LAPHRDWIVGRLTQEQDLTMRALVVELRERGIVTSECLGLAPGPRCLSFKKNAGRRRWKTYQGKLAPERLDQTWAKTNMTRTRGWSPRGDTLLAKVPHGPWKTLTFLAALRSDRIEAPFVLDRPINGKSFDAYIRQMFVTRRHRHHG
jgi:hypothetical protein